MNDIYLSWCKRIFDLVVCSIVFIVISPLFLILMIVIKLDSEGPSLFIQKRLGYKRRIFQAYKLRTMTNKLRVPDREIMGHDSEVTRIGYWLRRFKIDELPQLFNVIKGDMSIVGPRPALPSQLSELDDTGLKRLNVRPGLTGLSQINGNIYLTWPERWKFDAKYVDELSFLLDLKIIACTIGVVVFGEKKYKKVSAESRGQWKN